MDLMSSLFRPLYEGSLYDRVLLVIISSVLAVSLCLLGMFNNNLSWLVWNTVAASSTYFAFLTTSDLSREAD
jgi:hypothetical protein